MGSGFCGSETDKNITFSFPLDFALVVDLIEDHLKFRLSIVIKIMWSIALVLILNDSMKNYAYTKLMSFLVGFVILPNYRKNTLIIHYGP